jgi:methylated-DNA-[protein]-cysteine S-methyltransferase
MCRPSRAHYDVRNPPAAGTREAPESVLGIQRRKSAFEDSDMSYVYKTMQSPIGVLKLVGSDRGLAAVLWEHEDTLREQFGVVSAEPRHPILLQAQQELEEYFSGSRRRFTVQLDFAGTEFQNRVWNALRTIPFGETRSYGDIAGQIGSRKAVRAVGAANGRNPIPIIVPCHRVIGADGTLTGFAGGLEIKARLLALESA